MTSTPFYTMDLSGDLPRLSVTDASGAEGYLADYPNVQLVRNPITDVFRGDGDTFGPTLAASDAAVVANYAQTLAAFGASPLEFAPNNINTQNEKTYAAHGVVILSYEKARFQGRVAYNWRSDRQVTTAGNGTDNLPVYNKGFGQMDASLRYNINDVWSIWLDGVNLLDTCNESYLGVESRYRDYNNRLVKR